MRYAFPVEIMREKRHFELEWCEGEAKLRDILKLRKICFPALKGVLRESDLSARHLVIRDQTGQVCGAYRVTLSTDVSRFESEDDFVMGKFLRQGGVKAELAWACVHPDCRDGQVIHLLWRGLSEFLKAQKVRYVFGLASITTLGSEQVLDIINYLKGQNYIISHNSIQARNGYFSEKALVMERPQTSIKRRVLPGLLRAYLMAGALVCLQPVFDADLDCYDFMTVLDMESTSTTVASHFNFR